MRVLFDGLSSTVVDPDRHILHTLIPVNNSLDSAPLPHAVSNDNTNATLDTRPWRNKLHKIKRGATHKNLCTCGCTSRHLGIDYNMVLAPTRFDSPPGDPHNLARVDIISL